MRQTRKWVRVLALAAALAGLMFSGCCLSGNMAGRALLASPGKSAGKLVGEAFSSGQDAGERCYKALGEFNSATGGMLMGPVLSALLLGGDVASAGDISVADLRGQTLLVAAAVVACQGCAMPAAEKVLDAKAAEPESERVAQLASMLCPEVERQRAQEAVVAGREQIGSLRQVSESCKRQETGLTSGAGAGPGAGSD